MDSKILLKALLDCIVLKRLWSKEVTLERGAYLKREGTTDTNLYFVKEGSLRVFILDETDEKTIRFGYKGDLIASLDSYITGKPSPLLIQAIRKTEIKVIRKIDFMKMLDNDKELKASWTQILGVLLIGSMEREIDILTKSPQARYQRVLNRSPRLFQEIPNKYIASYLNMTPETLSRLKKS